MNLQHRKAHDRRTQSHGPLGPWPKRHGAGSGLYRRCGPFQGRHDGASGRLGAASEQRGTATVQAPGGTGPAPSLGDTILGTLQDLSADTRQRYAQIGEVLAKPDLNMSDLMSLQFTLLQTSLQFEIASKGISKLAQNIDSVLKTQ